MTDDPEVLALLAMIRPVHTYEKQAAALDKLYAYLATREDEHVTQWQFQNIAFKRYCWSVTQFDNWAQGKTWSTR